MPFQMRYFFVAVFLYAFTIEASAQSITARYKETVAAFKSNPVSYTHYENLLFLVSGHYLQLTAIQRKEIRQLLSEKAAFSTVTITSPAEKGIPLMISGMVTDDKKHPLPGVKILVFQTDARGYYAPDDSARKRMNEADSRLFGYITTDKNGNYSFQTIHPGTYPKKYEGRWIPQHIHLQIQHSGYKAFAIQMAFADDPAMKDRYWQDWAGKLQFPVITTIKTGKYLAGNYSIILQKE